jgi:hypothetical protein
MMLSRAAVRCTAIFGANDSRVSLSVSIDFAWKALWASAYASLDDCKQDMSDVRTCARHP